MGTGDFVVFFKVMRYNQMRRDLRFAVRMETAAGGDHMPQEIPRAPVDLLDFVEIDIEPGGNAGTQAAAAQKISAPQPPDDEKRRLFLEMRRLGRYSGAPGGFHERDQAASFYQQAKFMERFEDDYEGSAPFSSYYPDYRMMSYEQLRTYFTWRSGVRRGAVRETSYSYVFVYLYELINHIGVESDLDGLHKLLFIWKEYRKFNSKIDGYLAEWVRDYYIVNPFPFSFDALVQADGLLQEFYAPADAVSPFDLYAPLSKYKYERSIFYSKKVEQKLRECFDDVVRALNGYLGQSGATFHGLVFFSSKGSAWQPFRRALYNQNLDSGPDRTVKLSDREIYRLEHGRWLYSQNKICRTNGREIIGYVIKRIEQFYRRTTEFKYQLNVGRVELNVPEIPDRDGFYRCIDAAILAHYRRFRKKTVTVDPRRLEKIRADALATQELLLAGIEAEEERNAPLPVLPPPAAAPGNAAEDGWTRLAASLSPVEKAVAAMVLRGDSLHALHEYARRNHSMLEVVVDGINQKAVDLLDDSVIELTDEISVFEEYRDELGRVINIEPE